MVSYGVILGYVFSLAPVISCENLFQVDSNQLISEKCCDLTYQQINDLNSRVKSKVYDLVQEDYFKHYQFNLEMNCPFFECQSICFSPNCQLDLDVHSEDYDYDYDLDAKELSYLNKDSFLDSLCPTDENDNNTDDEWCDLDAKNGVVIDISRNPERFTGYVPSPERNIWSMIYQNQLEGECAIEQQVFYQIISGFHSSVSTHLCNDYYNNITNTWEPNLDLFNSKVGDFPERISNIYFNYAMITRAIKKVYPFLQGYKFNAHNSDKDDKIHDKIASIVESIPTDSNIFKEDIMFADKSIKDEFRTKFRNVTKLMDCVTCDRCRLWGKIQSSGYATALKILFDDPDKSLSKIELASLFNTFDRLTKSIDFINNFNYLKALRDSGIPEADTIKDSARSRENMTFMEELSVAFDEEWTEFVNALKFILNSYIDLPSNLKNITLFYLNRWWNIFVGTRAYSQEEDERYLYSIKA